MLEAARSQIAGTVSLAEVQSLPLNGRNFLELALLVPGVSPTNVGSTQLFPETSAVPGVSLSVGSQRNLSNNFIVDGLSANDDAAALSGITYGVDAVEQFQVVTSGGQAELGRALGGFVNVVTRSGTNVLHGTVYDYVRDDRPQREERARRREAADEPEAVRREPGRADRVESHVLFHERRAAQARSVGPGHDPARERSRHQRASGRDRLSRPARCQGRVPESGRFDERARQGGSSAEQAGSVRRPLQPLRHQLSQCARRRRAQRPERLVRPGQHRSHDRGQQHADALDPLGARDARPVRPRRPACAAHRSDRPRGEHRRRRLVRHELGQPHAPREQDVSGRQQPVAPGGRPRVEGRRRFPLQRRSDHLSAVGPRELRLLLARELPDGASTTTQASRRRSASPKCRRRIPTSASTCRTSGKPALA